MRDDFAKQLTERERYGHADHHHNYRRMKMFEIGDEEGAFGGREPMKARYRIGYSGKTFSENLNPLYGWLRTCVGKKWDKCYSELREKFDMRKVINDHILQHLYSTLEVNAYLNESGKVVVLNTWNNKEVPISRSGSTYYVCPKDGVVKLSSRPLKRCVIKQREVEAQRKRDAVTRTVDATHVLHLIDNVWFQFELKPIPEFGAFDEFHRTSIRPNERYVLKGGVYTPTGGVYHSSRRTASKKILKQLGIKH